MFKQFREILKDEWIIVGADCSQGGSDSNSASFFSTKHLDFPLEYHAQGVAATMTDAVQPILEKIFDVTGKPPLVAFEQNNGGVSEMERLKALNRLNKYKLYEMKVYGKADDSDTRGKLGFATTGVTRPIVLGDYKKAFDAKAFRIYYKASIDEHFTFVIGKTGKPEHAKGEHDDTVFSKAIAYQLYLTEEPPVSQEVFVGDLPDESLFTTGGFY